MDGPRGAPVRRRRVRVFTVAALAAVLAVIAAVVAGGHGSADRRHGSGAATVAPSPPPALTTDVPVAASLVATDGSFWLTGGGVLDRVGFDGSHAVQGAAPGGLVATTGSRVYLTETSDGRTEPPLAGGVAVYPAAGGSHAVFTEQQLGSYVESLAAAPSTGVWALSCCGPAPAGFQLIQRRDPATLAAVGGQQEAPAPTEGTLAAGPVGVWLVDGGSVRRIDSASSFQSAELDAAGQRADIAAVGDGKLVLVTPSELITLDATTQRVARTPLSSGLGAPKALAVQGNVAYVAYAAEVAGYDLTRLQTVGSAPVHDATALADGPGGVWAAAGSRLERVTLAAQQPATRRIPTGARYPGQLVDAAGHLFLTSTGDDTLERVDLGDGSEHLESPPGAGDLTTDGTTVVVTHADAATLQTFHPDGRPAHASANVGALTAAAGPHGLWVASAGGFHRYDPRTLQPDGAALTLPGEPAEAPELLAGPGGAYFLDVSGQKLYPLDGHDHRALTLQHPATAAVATVGPYGPVFVTDSGVLVRTQFGNDLRGESEDRLPTADGPPEAVAVQGDTTFVAYAGEVVSYEGAVVHQRYAVRGATALAAGADGVWAAASSEVVQLTGP